MNLPIILRVFKDDHVVEVKQFQLDQIVIGNQAEVNLSLKDPSVSPIHALIEKRNDIYYVCDLGSSQGTYRGGVQILDEPLESGDSVQIGSYTIQFNVGAPKPKVPAPDARELPKVPPTYASSAIVDGAHHLVGSNPPPLEVEPPSKVVPSAGRRDISSVAASSSESSDEVLSMPMNSIPSAPTSPIPSGASAVSSSDAAPSEIVTPERTPRTPTTVLPLPKAPTQSSSPKPALNSAFVPYSSVPEEDHVIRPSKGSVLEVSVGWKERIIETYHFRGSKSVVVGSDEKADIILPGGVFPGRHTIVDFQSGVATINVNSEMTGSLLSEKGTSTGQPLNPVVRTSVSGGNQPPLPEIKTAQFKELRQQGRFTTNARGQNTLKLEQGEACRVALVPGLINIYFRYVPATQKPTLVPFVPFTTGEIAGVVIATTLVGLLALYNVIHAPVPVVKEEIQPEIISVTKFVYPKMRPPQVQQPTTQPPPPPVKVEAKPEVKQKLVMGDKTEVAAAQAKPVPTPTKKPSGGGGGSRAAEAAPNKNVSAPKKFTSVQQGGAIKLGDQAGANASQTQKPVDLSTVGLTSSFGGGGARNKLSQTLTGAGGIIGDASHATGTSGFSKNRPGDDLGSAFKDTGAGGKGVSMEGISGGITNGRGSGNSGYGGMGSGLGDKSGVSVDVGGYGASFVGTIDRNGVLRVIRSKQAIIRRCYEKELRFKANLGGRVVVRFEIGEKGKVLMAKIDESSMADKGVETCLRNELVTWQFPTPPANTVAEVLFPFKFQPNEG